MKRFIALSFLVGVGVLAWRVGGSMSSDAVSMAVGVVFGVLASIPAALLVIAVSRRDSGQRSSRQSGGTVFPGGGQYAAGNGYPPVVVVSPPALPAHPHTQGVHAQGWPGGWQNDPRYDVIEGSYQRQFTVIGEEDDFVDEFYDR